jgi:hypothetical protein
VSKHPGNPYWCQTHDNPIVIHSREEWDAAAAAGYVTTEHVFMRLKNIADHIFENESSMGFDDDGFVISLVGGADTLEGGLKLRVWPNDHPPPHVHVEIQAHPEWTIRINLETVELMDELPNGLKAKQFRGFLAAVHECHPKLADWWETYHGEPVVLS